MALEDAVVGLDDAEEGDLASRHPDRAGVAGHEAITTLLAPERDVEHQPTAVERARRSEVGLRVPIRHQEEEAEPPSTIELVRHVAQDREPLVRVLGVCLHLGEGLCLRLAQLDGQRQDQCGQESQQVLDGHRLAPPKSYLVFGSQSRPNRRGSTCLLTSRLS